MIKLVATLACVITVLFVSNTNTDNISVSDATVPSLANQAKKIVTVVKTNERVHLTQKEFHCLVKNVYHEAGIEPKEGKLAVAQVTINRLNEGRWGNDVCKVVYAKSQFSWTLDKKKRWTQPSGELWNASIDAVKDFQRGIRVRDIGESTFYHADYIRQPRWAKVHEFTAKIGRHIFYKI